jgi:predicted AlkP superfamily pyrophosphatase or phosphodiesterase
MQNWRKTWLSLSTLLFLLPGLSAHFAAQRGSASIPARDRTVVVISLDGFPAWALEDPYLPVPTLRRLAREGTFAKRMTTSNPTYTWPNHTTLVTGVPPLVHGVLHNGLLVHEGPTSPVRVDPERSKSELVHAPTVYDLAYERGLTTAQVDWPATMNATTFSWAFPEKPEANGNIEQELIAEGALTKEDCLQFMHTSPAWRDEIWTRAGVHILKSHKPNLLLFHLLNVDAMNHYYGPKSWASYSAYAYIDTCVQQIISTIESSGLRDRTTVLIVSDHGFRTVKRSIRANAVLYQHGLLKAEGNKITCDAYVLAEGGCALVYITNPQNRTRLTPRLNEIFRTTEGVDRIVEPQEYHCLGLPTPQENSQAPDLLIFPKETYAFYPEDYRGKPVGDIEEGQLRGHHGWPSSDPSMDAIFIAWGYGIRPGFQVERIDNEDVAPTVAALLNLKMTDVKGKALIDMFEGR